MRKLVPALVVAVVLGLIGVDLSASGPLGIYGIVEKVVFEPSESAAERIQVWGAFAYVDGGTDRALGVSAAKRGYLYFKSRSSIPGFTSQSDVDATKKEWADLKAVAGTGQAVGFGSWGYIAGFSALQPDSHPTGPSMVWERMPQGGAPADLRVRPSTEAPANPATYQTNTGIVKLAATGSHAAIVKQLRSALGK